MAHTIPNTPPDSVPISCSRYGALMAEVHEVDEDSVDPLSEGLVEQLKLQEVTMVTSVEKDSEATASLLATLASTLTDSEL